MSNLKTIFSEKHRYDQRFVYDQNFDTHVKNVDTTNALPWAGIDFLSTEISITKFFIGAMLLFPNKNEKIN